MVGKYVSWEDFERNVPKQWAEETKPENYKAGLQRICPPGYTVKEERVKSYAENTDEEHGKKLVRNYKVAMFKPKAE